MRQGSYNGLYNQNKRYIDYVIDLSNITLKIQTF